MKYFHYYLCRQPKVAEWRLEWKKSALFGGTPASKTPISYGRQYIDDEDIQAVANALHSDYLTTCPNISDLEKELCKHKGAKYAVVCSNGIAALHIACIAAGISEGDEVITTPITFAASANWTL